MSAYDGYGYDDEPRRYRNVRTRPRDRDEPDYVREETYIERGKGPGPRGAELVYRGREDSVEDIPRDFPPPGRDGRRYDDYASHRRSKSAGGRRYSDDYDDDRYTDYGPAAAAGAAGYAAGRRKERDRRRHDRDYDSEYDESPPRRERKKSGVGDMLEGLGLGGLVGGLVGGSKDKKDRSRSGSRGGRSARSRSRAGSRRGYESDESGRSRGGGKKRTERKWAQAAQAALVAGAVEAFRSRKEPGPWTGDKGKRIATAAIGAGGIDGLIDRDPDKKTKRHLAEAVIGGLAANRLANGPRSKSRGRGVDSRDVSPDSRAPRSRSRSIIDRFRGRSQSRGPGDEGGGGGGGSGAIKGLVGAGALAAAGKAVYDRVRSKSRKRRSPSNSSADSYVVSRTRRRDKRGSPNSDTGTTRRTDAGTGREVARGTRDPSASAVKAGAAGAGAGAAARGNGDDNGDNISSDSSSTTDMEKTRKHMRGKELITAGLATIATIHAAHGVYSSMEAHEKRHKLVAEGEMSPQKARKEQTKAWVQDAAAVGIAALGIKGAFSEWKEMNEQRREIQEIEKRKAQRRKKRVARQKQEERERHERMMNILEKNPQLAMGYHMQQNGYPLLPGQGGQSGQGSQAPPPPDLSGNPYAPRNGGR
ncbi:hypothetical protein PRZ48_002116 [Zasmidium cellare]|uniref:Uncharacterized protein n=1 Tax=Zasmidium cellare TaxID=395010 RepID=A0ABR0F546_ZASCE|nr:hypothetical protein PRZ48_002116 [Zasmidium cellare]